MDLRLAGPMSQRVITAAIYKQTAMSHLQPNAPQSQRIAHDRHRTEAHGGGDHGRQEQAEQRIKHACCDGDAQGIVDKGEKQVLLDVAHGCLAVYSDIHGGLPSGAHPEPISHVEVFPVFFFCSQRARLQSHAAFGAISGFVLNHVKWIYIHPIPGLRTEVFWNSGRSTGNKVQRRSVFGKD